MAGTLEQATAALHASSFDVAEAGFRAILGGADGIEALHCLGLIAQQRGDLAGSLMLIQAAHHLAPSARLAHNLAVVLSGLGRTDEAIAQALAAANLDLTYIPARFGLAALLVASGALPDAAGVLIGTAEKALRSGNQDVARRAVDQLLLINVDHPSLLMLANMLRMVGWETDGHRLLAIRLRVAPDDIGARLTRAVAILTPVHPDEKEIERQRTAYAAELADIAKLTECASREQLIVGASAIGLAQPFLLGYHGCDVRDLQCRYGRVIAQLASAATYPPVPQPTAPCDGERVRVGFASSFLHLHSVSKTHGGWIEHLDRSRFAVFGYQFSELTDAVSERILSGCDSFARGVMDVAKWRARILADAPHVLVYLDIGMEQIAVRVAALRLAQVQCTTWGHPVTSGLPTIDHYLSSEAMEPPNGDAHYTEHLVRLPGLGIHYTPPAHYWPADGPLCARTQQQCSGVSVVPITVQISASLRCHLATYRRASSGGAVLVSGIP